MQDLDLGGGESLPLRKLPAGRIELGDDAPYRRHGEPGEGLAVRHGYLVFDRRSEQPRGREHARVARHDHSRNAEIGSERARVERPRTAHGDQCEFARVEPLAHRNEADAFRHLGIDHLMNTGGSVFQLDPPAAPQCCAGSPRRPDPGRAGLRRPRTFRGPGIPTPRTRRSPSAPGLRVHSRRDPDPRRRNAARLGGRPLRQARRCSLRPLQSRLRPPSALAPGSRRSLPRHAEAAWRPI